MDTKVFFYNVRLHRAGIVGGAVGVTDRIVPYLPEDWEVLMSNWPKDYERRPEKYAPYYRRCQNGRINDQFRFKEINWDQDEMDGWEGVMKAVKTPLKKTMFSKIPHVDVVMTTTFNPKSRAEWADWIKTLYELAKVNPDLIVLENDGDFNKSWHETWRKDLVTWIKPDHYWVVTPYRERIYQNQLVADFGIDPTRYLPVHKGDKQFVFFGTQYQRSYAITRQFIPMAERGVQMHIYGGWANNPLVKNYPNVTSSPSTEYFSLHDVLKDYHFSMNIVRRVYEPAGLMPLRVFEVPEAGCLQTCDAAIGHASDYFAQEYIFEGGVAAARFATRLNAMTEREYLERVEEQRYMLEEACLITREIDKYVQLIGDKLAPLRI